MQLPIEVFSCDSAGGFYHLLFFYTGIKKPLLMAKEASLSCETASVTTSKIIIIPVLSPKNIFRPRFSPHPGRLKPYKYRLSSLVGSYRSFW
jgi:hypothetical protein